MDLGVFDGLNEKILAIARLRVRSLTPVPAFNQALANAFDGKRQQQDQTNGYALDECIDVIEVENVR
jgi:hypothetical protein